MSNASEWCKGFCTNNPIPSPLRKTTNGDDPKIVSSKPAKPGEGGYSQDVPRGTKHAVDSKGDEYSMKPSSVKSQLQAIMDKPYVPGKNFNLSNINTKAVGGGGAAGLIMGLSKGKGAVKDAKENLSTAQSKVDSTQGEYDRASSLRDYAQTTLDNYCTQGYPGTGAICTNIANGIQDGTVTVEDFNHLANMNAGNITGGDGQPYVYGSGYMTNDNINQVMSSHEKNLSSKVDAEQLLKSAKKKRVGKAALGTVLGGLTGFVADKGIGWVKKKIQEKKLEKQKPKHNW